MIDRALGAATLRLFFGLPIPVEAQPELERWQGDVFRGADVRPTAPEHLHATLAFLGGRPAVEVDSLAGVLREVAEGQPRPTLTPVRYRETERVAMLVFADEGNLATALQTRLSARLEALGVYRPEQRAWLPHVTVARFQRRPALHPALPALGPVSPLEAVLYQSTLRPEGAAYVVLARASLAQVHD